MASLCERQQCSIERRGFRQELDSWRHKLIHCVGFESILEGLFGPGLVEDLTLFKDCEPTAVSDWSFDENCLFCCLRREKVKEHLIGLNDRVFEEGDRAHCKQEQSKINRLEKQAEEFLNAVLYRKEVPSFSDPHIPRVAREIMQRMIRQFAAEYTSKSSSSQDSLQPNGAQDQSPPVAPSPAASAQNPVLSKLLMADQDSPLDLTVKKPEAEPSEQDGVLDLSTKKSHTTGSTSLRAAHGCPATPVKGRPVRAADHNFQDGDEEGPPDGRPTPFRPPLARSLQIMQELQARTQPPPAPLSHPRTRGQRPPLSEDGSWRPKLDGLLKLRASGVFNDLNDLPSLLDGSGTFPKGPAPGKPPHEGRKDPGHSPPVDLKIPQVRGMDLSMASDLYGYGALVVSPHGDSALSRRLRSILPKHGALDGGPDLWPSDVERSASGQQYPTSDPEGDAASKQPRKKRGRYRQYNTEILEEAIGMVMNGGMSVSKAQTVYGIPHSTLEYKVKERLGTLKNPPKKRVTLKPGQDAALDREARERSSHRPDPALDPEPVPRERRSHRPDPALDREARERSSHRPDAPLDPEPVPRERRSQRASDVKDK